jgi:hypothetical protein
LNWGDAITQVTPHVVRIETPNGYGTGILAFYNHDAKWCGIATAAHVVTHADDWQHPIRVRNFASTRFLKSEDRVVMKDLTNDSAIVLFFKGDLQLPKVPIALTPVDKPCSIGADVGWLGFPVIEADTLCFFAGTVSAHQPARKLYLIDGVAINGVSGGPVFHCGEGGQVQVIGSVSAYHANRATGEALPGLLRAQDVSHFHGSAQTVKDIDQARATKAEFEAAQRQASESPQPIGDVSLPLPEARASEDEIS